MADLSAQIAQARQAGYSDQEITAYLGKDPTLQAKIGQAKAAGYGDGEIVDHLAGPAQAQPATAPQAPAHENVFQKAARLTGQEWNAASAAYKTDLHAATHKGPGGTVGTDPLDVVGTARPVLDALGAAMSPVKGVMDATFGDQPLHLPVKIAGVQVPKWAQDINSKGLTGGDVASFALPVAGELAGANKLDAFAKGAGIAPRTAQQTIAASKAGAPAVAASAAPAITPTVDALRANKTAAYNAADSAGIQYTPDAFNRLVTNTASDLQAAKINPARHPKAASMLEDLQTEAKAGKSPTLTELDQLRQVVNRDVASAPDAAERFMGRKIVDNIDKFVEGTQQSDVVSGASQDAANLIGAARDANARYRKAEAVTNAVERAKLQAGSTGSGGNIDNAIRQKLRVVLEKTPNLTPDEKDALRGIVVGTPGQNVMRQVGKLSPQGNGLMAALNVGGAATAGALGGPAGGIAGAIPGAVGMAAKFVADRATTSKVDDLLKLIAAGGKRAAVPRSAASRVAGKAASAVAQQLPVAANPFMLPALQGLSGAAGQGAAAAGASTNPLQSRQ